MGLPMEHFFRIEQDYGCLNIIDYFEDGVKVVKLLNGGPNLELNIAKVY
jgi:alpha-ribazole phosphatase/probable phosphoglycerate mutase